MRLEIHGGPFDGGAVDVPRRTAPGLRLSLTTGDVTAFYRILGTHGGACAVVFEELAVIGSPTAVEVPAEAHSVDADAH